MKVILFGGSGILGRHLIKTIMREDMNLYAPTRNECDIESEEDVENIIKDSDVVIHSAGFVNTSEAEQNPDKCIDANVIGTYNIVKSCRKYGKRLVYISSEYVFDGEDNPYTTDSGLKPKGIYGITKACGELLVQTLNNYLIIRAPFWREVEFNVPKAFANQYTNRQYVHEICDDIIDYSLDNETIGTKHIIGKYQSLLDLARETKPDIEGIEIPDKFKDILPERIELL